MAKALLVIAPEGYQDKELGDTKKALEQGGHSVVITSTKETAHGKLGGETGADILVDQVNAYDFDAAVFIGGPGSVKLASNPKITLIAKKLYDTGKVVAAVCAAPLVLAKSGILDGKKATCHESEVGAIKQACALYTGKPVEIDGNIITADGPESAYDFGKAISDKLNK